MLCRRAKSAGQGELYGSSIAVTVRSLDPSLSVRLIYSLSQLIVRLISAYGERE